MVVLLGQNPIDALTDDIPVRYALDNVWDRNGVNTCLSMGQWNFAARSARLEYEPSITPDFGYRFAFEKPSDFVRVMGVCSDEYFRSPLRSYTFEAGYWFCDLEQLYVRYVSNGNQYGLDFSLWPEKFTRFVEGWFALQITNLSTYSEKREPVKEDVAKLLREAHSFDAMEQPSKSMPRGSWSSSRGSSSGDFGSRSRLIG